MKLGLRGGAHPGPRGAARSGPQGRSALRGKRVSAAAGPGGAQNRRSAPVTRPLESHQGFRWSTALATELSS